MPPPNSNLFNPSGYAPELGDGFPSYGAIDPYMILTLAKK